MKRIEFRFLVLLAGVPLFLYGVPTTGFPADDVVAYQIGEQGANQRVWQKIICATDAQGNLVLRTNRAYVEVATGLNYEDPATGKWLPSKEEIDAYPSGAIAQYGQHKVIFAENLNTSGALDLQMSDGNELRSDLLGLAYYDTASDKSVLIAEVKDCHGQIVNSNQVIYSDAFNGVSGNVRYRYTRAGLEQDVILLASPAPPEAFGLSSTSSVLQVLTEFISAPVPTINALPDVTTGNGGLSDESVDFGAMRMVEGNALLVGTNSISTAVSKQWTTVNGRTVLVESVYLPAISKSLAQLPALLQTTVKPVNGSVRYVVSNERLLPAPKAARDEKAAMKLAQETLRGQGLILDYTVVNSGGSTVFQGDTTYYVSGAVYLYGASTFEGGTVLKFATNGTILVQSGSPTPSIIWKGGAYRPVVFTAKDDNTVGQNIDNSTGQPWNFTYSTYLTLVNVPSLPDITGLHVRYAQYGLVIVGGSANIYDSQFVSCWEGLSVTASTVFIGNVLFAGDLTGFAMGAGTVSAQNTTFYSANQAAAGPSFQTGAEVAFTNCIFASVLSPVTGVFLSTSGNYNGLYNSPWSSWMGPQTVTSPSNPFQSAGGGNCYLAAGGAFRNVGTLNIKPALLADLPIKTTRAPDTSYVNQTISSDTTFSPLVQRDTDTPDLGYHYDPIDYAVSGVSLNNAIVSVYPGTVIAAFGTGDSAFGLNFSGGTEFLCKGLATNWNRIVAYNTVQEQGGTAWQAPTNGLITDASGDASSSLNCRFTDWSVPAQDEPFLAFSNHTDIALRDCQFHGGSLILDYSSGIDPAINNCLFERVNFILNAFSGSNFSCQNNLFWHGTFNFAPVTGDAIVQNNLFDQTAIPTNSVTHGTYIGGYNAYVTNCDQLQPASANDLVLTNPPVYLVGPLGNYYRPTNSPLINAGSTNADALGLYDYTVLTNLVGGQEIKEANSLVDIGYHHVAVDSNNIPLTTYTNGLPDYLVTSNTDPIPDWWEYIYFGNLDQATNGDYDNDGTNNLTEYQNGTDPNKISFSFSVPEQYVTNRLVPCVITILGGVPASISVVVDPDSSMETNWTAYASSNIIVDLGTSQGMHDLWIGLRGLPVNAYQTGEDTTLILDSTSPTITITNPADGVSLNASRVNVSGNFTAASLKQITVNGILAFMNGTDFEARNVPLDAGANAITAIIENLPGLTNAVSINVIGITNSDGSMNDPVQLQATPVAGFAPLTVTFQITSNAAPGTIQQVFYDFNGDDIADLVTNNLDSLSYIYATNGEYFPVVTIQTTAGRFSSIGGWNAVWLDPSSQPIRINVQSPPTLTTTLSHFQNPVDLKWDGTHLYVLSGSGGAIYEFATNGNTIRWTNNIGSTPSGFDVDGAGSVYVAVNGNNQVWKFNPTDNSFQIDTNFGIGGCIGLPNGASGSNTNEFNQPFDVAVAPNGQTISVSDSGNHRIQQFSAASGAFVASFGIQGSTIGQFNAPKGLTYDASGTLYIADSQNNRLVLAEGSAVMDATGSGGNGLGQFSGALNIGIGRRGVYVADTGNGRIQKFDLPAQGLFEITPGNVSYAFSTGLDHPAAVAAVDNLTNELFYVADTGHDRVILCQVPDNNPDELQAVWDTMTAHVANGEISGAAQCFSSKTADGYQQAFLCIGTAKTISDINDIGPLTPAYIENDLAQYYFEQTVNGLTLLFPVQFVRENGTWKIFEF